MSDVPATSEIPAPPFGPFDEQATVIVEIIMSQHWDMVACQCWICVEGRKAGCRPRDRYLGYKMLDARRARVWVEAS